MGFWGDTRYTITYKQQGVSKRERSFQVQHWGLPVTKEPSYFGAVGASLTVSLIRFLAAERTSYIRTRRATAWNGVTSRVPRGSLSAG